MAEIKDLPPALRSFVEDLIDTLELFSRDSDPPKYVRSLKLSGRWSNGGRFEIGEYDFSKPEPRPEQRARVLKHGGPIVVSNIEPKKE